MKTALFIAIVGTLFAAPSVTYAQADVALMIDASSGRSATIMKVARAFFAARKLSVADAAEVTAAAQFAALGDEPSNAEYQKLRDTLTVSQLVVVKAIGASRNIALRIRAFSAAPPRTEFARAQKKTLKAQTRALLERLTADSRATTAARARQAAPQKTKATAASSKAATTAAAEKTRTARTRAQTTSAAASAASARTATDPNLALQLKLNQLNQLEMQYADVSNRSGARTGQIVGYTMLGVGAIAAAVGGFSFAGSDCNGAFLGGGCDGQAALAVGGGIMALTGLITGIVSSVNAADNNTQAEALQMEIEALKAEVIQ